MPANSPAMTPVQQAIAVWIIHYNCHRLHSGAAGKPPASRLLYGVTNVQPSYT